MLMKKKIFLLLSFCISLLSASAEEVSKEEAMRLAADFFASSKTTARRAPLKMETARKSTSLSVDGSMDNLYYVINRGSNEGFVIVAGDDRVTPILAYADEGSITENDMQMNTSVKWMLDEYARQIAWAKQNMSDKPSTEFTGIRRGKARAKQSYIEISPLLKVSKWNREQQLPATISWGQSWPFNKYCPNIKYDGETYSTVSGCVATAIATVMRWHQWPRKPKGECGYWWRRRWLSLDFDAKDAEENAPYNWAQMPASISSSGYDRQTWEYVTDLQADNIGRLLRDVGYSISMTYGRAADGGSGAYLYNAPTALVNNFGYSNDLKWMKRSKYTKAAWLKHIKEEMRDYGPVVYVGYSSGGGHCFVLDGFATEGYVHVDWGWTGSQNGWYLLDVLEPGSHGIGGGSGGYSRDQEMLRYLYPDGDDRVVPDNGGDDNNNNNDDNNNGNDNDNNSLVVRPSLVGPYLYVTKTVNVTAEQANSQKVTVTLGNRSNWAYRGKIAMAIYKEGALSSTLLTSVQAEIASGGTKELTFSLNLANYAAGKYNLSVNYENGASFKAISKAGEINVQRVEPKPEPKPEPVVLTYSLVAEGGVKAEGKVGEHAKIPILMYHSGNKDFNGMLELYAVNQTNGEVTLISDGKVRIVKTSRPVVTFYTDPAFLTLKAGTYDLRVRYASATGTMVDLYTKANGSVAATKKLGTLTMVGATPVVEKKKDVRLKTVEFFQGGKSLGTDNVSIPRLKGNFQARLFLGSDNGYKGKVCIYLTDVAGGNKAFSDKFYAIKDLDMNAGESGYIDCTFSPTFIARNDLYVNILFQKEGSEEWFYNPEWEVPFSLVFFSFDVYYTDLNDKLTDGPTYEMDVLDEMLLPAAVVGVAVNAPNEGEELSESVVITGVKTINSGDDSHVLMTFKDGQLHVETQESVAVNVYSMQGATMLATRVEAGSHAIALETLPQGVYIAKVGSKSLRFVKN